MVLHPLINIAPGRTRVLRPVIQGIVFLFLLVIEEGANPQHSVFLQGTEPVVSIRPRQIRVELNISDLHLLALKNGFDSRLLGFIEGQSTCQHFDPVIDGVSAIDASAGLGTSGGEGCSGRRTGMRINSRL